MDTFIQLSVEQRRRLCQLAGDSMGLDAQSIEKDFWVCWTLRELFGLAGSGRFLTFKGGTSLSKGWKLIERFSEDIDVVIDRDFLGFGGEQAPDKAVSGKQRGRRLEALQMACQKHIQERLRPSLTRDFEERLPQHLKWKLDSDSADQDGQTLLFEYPTVFPAGGYLRPVVKIELGARSDTEPSATPEIRPYIAEALPAEIGASQFSIRTVAPERTFWEKAMLLHEENIIAKAPRARLARHYYDLWCLIRAGVAERAAADLSLFERVAAHRSVFFRKRKDAQESLRRGSLRISPSSGQESFWKKDYEQMREGMFFGDPPSFDEILRLIGEFEQEFNHKGQ
jgi:predicted nucleotidyltransferase component of viral defense system